MPCSQSQPLICSGDQRIRRNFASTLRRNGAVSLRGLIRIAWRPLSLRFRLLEPIPALPPIAAHLSGHRALAYAQNFSDAFLAGPSLAQRINLAAILIHYPSVVAHRQPLEISRDYPSVALLNYALGG
jgi:hypothetical protein